MPVLYLHGLEAKPSEAKFKILETKFGQGQVFMPSLNYHRPFGEIWAELCNLTAATEADFLMGSSFGGFWAYWLGQTFELPQLLFNPAMALTEQLAEQNIPHQIAAACPSWVVVGAKDEVVPPSINHDFFQDKPQTRLITCAWLAHRIDLQTFSETLDWAIGSKKTTQA